MKKIFALILVMIDMALMVACFTCLIIAIVLYHNAQAYQAPLVNTLFACGFVGIGMLVASILIETANEIFKR